MESIKASLLGTGQTGEEQREGLEGEMTNA